MMRSKTFASMVRYFTDDLDVSSGDVEAALEELDNEFRLHVAGGRPISLDRYRLRKVLKAVAAQRGLASRG